jgi:multidrug efflux pump subunit AcrB
MVGSYLAAMTVIPLFTSRYLRQTTGRPTGLIGFVQGRVAALTQLYRRVLSLVLRFRFVALPVTAIALTLMAIALAPRIGSELFPRADAGNFTLDVRAASGLRIEKTIALAGQIEHKLREWIPPEDLRMIIANAGVYYGFPAAFTPNSGTQDVFFSVELTEDRRHTSQYYAKMIRERLPAEFPGTELGIELGGLLTSALNGGLRSPIDVQVMGPRLERSHDVAIDLAAAIKRLPGAVDVRVQQRFDAPQIHLEVDRKEASKLGLTPDGVVRNVVSAVSGSGTFNPAIWIDPKTGIDYPFQVQYPENKFVTFDDLMGISITSNDQNRSVPLRRIARTSLTKGPSEINHVNLKPVIDIYLDAQARDVGSLSRDVEQLIRRSDMPAGYSAVIRGEISEMKKSVGLLGGGFLLAAVLVYLILVVQFRSFLLPTIIMVTVPMGIVGIITMLSLTHTYFSIQAAIGAIFMIGIAVANGVLLIEFILHHSTETDDIHQAIVDGASARLRPILMTSLASILGLVPMAIGLGHGSEANIPLGRAVIGGQLLSTSLTLFIVPCLFRIFFKLPSVDGPAAGSPAVTGV